MKFDSTYLEEFHNATEKGHQTERMECSERCPPPHSVNKVKLNFDGAISSKFRWAGIGIVARNLDGSFLAARSKPFADIIDPEHAELLDLREAIELCKN